MMGERIVHAALAFALGAIAFIVVWDYRPPIHIDKAQAIPDTVRAGDELTVKVNMTIKRECPGNYYRSLISQTPGKPVQLYDPSPIDLHADEWRDIHVPAGFSKGPATLKAQAVFICNPLQWFYPLKIELPPLHVTVLPDTDDDPTGLRRPQPESPAPTGKQELRHALERE